VDYFLWVQRPFDNIDQLTQTIQDVFDDSRCIVIFGRVTGSEVSNGWIGVKITSYLEHMLRNNQSLEQVQVPMDKMAQAPNL
jgi:hypothetical protein